MPYKKLTLELTGVAPLLLHNSRLADPLDEFARALKKVSSKRAKTDADHEEMGRLEWLGGLYMADKVGPCIPQANALAMLVAGAKFNRLGKAAKAGIVIDKVGKIEYDGPREPEKMWAAGKFIDKRSARINGKSRIMRTRPRFDDWKVTLEVMYEPTIVDRESVIRFAEKAGEVEGLGDNRPQFGRFTVVAK